jgi:hypothetical protein
VVVVYGHLYASQYAVRGLSIATLSHKHLQLLLPSSASHRGYANLHSLIFLGQQGVCIVILGVNLSFTCSSSSMARAALSSHGRVSIHATDKSRKRNPLIISATVNGMILDLKRWTMVQKSRRLAQAYYGNA